MTDFPTRRERSASKRSIGRGLLYNHDHATAIDPDWESQLERIHDNFTEDAAARRRRFMRTEAMYEGSLDVDVEPRQTKNPYVGLADKHTRGELRRSMVDMRAAQQMYAAWPLDEMEGLILYCEKLRGEKLAAEKQLADLYTQRARESSKGMIAVTSGTGSGYVSGRRDSVDDEFFNPSGGFATPRASFSHRSPSFSLGAHQSPLLPQSREPPHRNATSSTPVLSTKELTADDVAFLETHYDSL